MNPRWKIIQIISIFLFIAGTFFGCAARDPSDITLKVAKNWTANNVNIVSKNIAGLVAGSNPLIEAAVTAAVSQQINKSISWEYSTPQKIEDNLYGIIATAYSEIELPLLGNYKISVNYNLQIDTEEKQVSSATIDPGSFTLKKK